MIKIKYIEKIVLTGLICTMMTSCLSLNSGVVKAARNDNAPVNIEQNAKQYLDSDFYGSYQINNQYTQSAGANFSSIKKLDFFEENGIPTMKFYGKYNKEPIIVLQTSQCKIAYTDLKLKPNISSAVVCQNIQNSNGAYWKPKVFLYKFPKGTQIAEVSVIPFVSRNVALKDDDYKLFINYGDYDLMLFSSMFMRKQNDTQ